MIIGELDIEKIPSVPHVLLELLEKFYQKEVDFGEIAKIIESDPVISAKILNFAHSPFYRPWSRVSHVRRLIVVLGIDEVRHIALTSAVHQYFSSFSEEHEGLITSLWIRSLLCGHIASELAQLIGYSSKEEAYTAGLLHRLGQLVLLHNHPEKYLDILFMDAPASLREQTERALFSTSYSEVGATLIRSWPLHPFVADAVLYQNTPPSSLKESTSLVKILNLANRLTDIIMQGTEDAFECDDTLFSLNAELLKEVTRLGRETTNESAKRFGVHADWYLDPDSPLPEEAETLHRDARKRLSTYVYHSAIVGSCQSRPAADLNQNEGLAGIRRDLAITFGLHDVRFLLLDEQGKKLVGLKEAEQDFFSDFSIDLQDSTSLAALAVGENVLQCTLQHEPQSSVAIIDQQLTSLFDTEGILFLPLVSEGDCLGVVVAGLASTCWNHLSPQKELIHLFTWHLADRLQKTRKYLASYHQNVDEQTAWHQLEARKILHEANNPLSIINNYLYTLSTKLNKNDAASEDIAVIREEIARVGEILARLKKIGQPEHAHDGLVNLNRIISDLVKLFEKTLFQKHGLQAELELDENIPPLYLDSGALKQVLINLAKNAAEAMTEGGKLLIVSRDRIYKGKNLFVELEISDNGPGLPEKVLSSLFEPVTSTKENHSGLGLAIVKNLVDNLSGEISCFSSKETGTRFQILLPRREKNSVEL